MYHIAILSLFYKQHYSREATSLYYTQHYSREATPLFYKHNCSMGISALKRSYYEHMQAHHGDCTRPFTNDAARAVRLGG